MTAPNPESGESALALARRVMLDVQECEKINARYPKLRIDHVANTGDDVQLAREVIRLHALLDKAPTPAPVARDAETVRDALTWPEEPSEEMLSAARAVPSVVTGFDRFSDVETRLIAAIYAAMRAAHLSALSSALGEGTARAKGTGGE